MVLSNETIEKIVETIQSVDYTYDEGWTSTSAEFQQGKYYIVVDYQVLVEYVREYNYHSEVMFDCDEDVSYNEFADAIIEDIYVYDEEAEEEVEVENKNDIKYIK